MAISEEVIDKIANNKELNSALAPEEQYPSQAGQVNIPAPMSNSQTDKQDGPFLPAPTSQNENSAPVLQPAMIPTATDSIQPHPDHDEILRQVEYYFSDANLPYDAHLLARTGPTGDNWVSINEILGFKKMRGYKPKAQVKKSLSMSTFIEVKDGKFIRRRTPLPIAPRVKAEISEKRERDRKLVEQPWLTKGMLKPTGFEQYATDGPITPAEYEEERKLFDPEEAFTVRIEAAVNRFVQKRKMHQNSNQIFTKFLLFGGFQLTSEAFTGGLSKKDLEEFSKEEIDAMQTRYKITTRTHEGLLGDAGDDSDWVVDFEGMAKAFLSSEFLQRFDWKDETKVIETTNVLRKFYNYLLQHDACPEYRDDVLNARAVCDLAEKQLPKLAFLDSALPGDFNKACSTVHGGHYASIRPMKINADWAHPEDVASTLSEKDAWTIFSASITAYGTDAQVEAVLKTSKDLPCFPGDEEMGIEVVSIEQCTEDAKQIYDSPHLKDTIVKPAGKLHCKRWKVPHALPLDLPVDVLAAEKAKLGQKYEFIVEENVLQYCDPGMKLEVRIKELKCGVKWIDAVVNVYPSFFKWTLNERMRDYKEPGPPKAWMERQIKKAKGMMVEGGDVDGDGLVAGEEDSLNDETVDGSPG